MTDRMTDKEIIKTLECCSNAEPCENCPCQKQCYETDLIEIALDLINRQQAEIENYIKVAEYQQNLTLKKSFEIKELKAEIERLQKVNDSFTDIGKLYSEIRIETIKECLGKIEQIDVSESDDYIMVKKYKFDSLVKEMLGERF